MPPSDSPIKNPPISKIHLLSKTSLHFKTINKKIFHNPTSQGLGFDQV